MWTTLFRICDAARHRARSRLWTPDLAAGRRGEDLAHRHLQKLGFTVVARNYRTRSNTAEVDLVAWDGDTLVFVEVKSRATGEFGAPDRAVGPDKRRRMFRGAFDYARRAEVPWERVRFDLVNVILADPPEVTHLKDVFPVRAPE